jgi:hypothetical protein
VDIYLSPYRLTGTIETRKNPFTGEVRDWPGREPQSKSELGAVLGLLQRLGARPSHDPDDPETELVSFDDGSIITVLVNREGHGGALSIQGPRISSSVAQFLFDLMRAGNLIVTGVGAEKLCIVPAGDLLPGVPITVGLAKVADSASALAAALTPILERA